MYHYHVSLMHLSSTDILITKLQEKLPSFSGYVQRNEAQRDPVTYPRSCNWLKSLSFQNSYSSHCNYYKLFLVLW